MYSDTQLVRDVKNDRFLFFLGMSYNKKIKEVCVEWLTTDFKRIKERCDSTTYLFVKDKTKIPEDMKQYEISSTRNDLVPFAVTLPRTDNEEILRKFIKEIIPKINKLLECEAISY